MACQLRNGLFVHPLVEHSGDEVVAQGVQMKRRGEAQFTENLSQALGKGVRVNRLSLGVGEQVGADLPVVLPGHALLEVVQTPQRADHIVGDGHGTAAAILGGPLHHPFPRNHAAGAADYEIPGVVAHKGEVTPPQGTQLSPAAAGVDCQNVEGVVEDVLLGQGVEKVLCLLVCRDELFPPLRVRQVDHPGGVTLDDLVSLGVAEDGGHHGQVFLDSGFLDGFALVGAFAQLYLLKQRQLPLLAVSKKEEGFPGGLPGDVGQLIGQQIVGGYLQRICDADQCLQAGPSLSGLYGADSGRGFSNGFGQLFLGKARLPPGGLNAFSQLFVVDLHKQNLQL